MEEKERSRRQVDMEGDGGRQRAVSYSSPGREGGREGSADFSEDENLPLPHGLFSSLFFSTHFLLDQHSFSFYSLWQLS